MKKGLETVITNYEQGSVTVEDAYNLVDVNLGAQIDANEFLGCVVSEKRIERREK
jgi:hypothetical protein